MLLSALFLHDVSLAQEKDSSTQQEAPPKYVASYEHIKGENFASYLEKAEKGDPQAQYEVGYCYAEGVGTEVNHELALKWLRESAKKKVPGAYYFISRAYNEGKGVKKNVKTSLKWKKKAADLGLAEAQCSLAIAYEIGHGVKKNPRMAKRYFEKAAAQGEPNSVKWLSRQESK